MLQLLNFAQRALKTLEPYVQGFVCSEDACAVIPRRVVWRNTAWTVQLEWRLASSSML